MPIPSPCDCSPTKASPSDSTAKFPGPNLQIRPVRMHFSYDTEFGAYTPEAYERLLLEALAGDATLFIRRDEVEAAWDDRRFHPRGVGRQASDRTRVLSGRQLGDRKVPLNSSRPRATPGGTLNCQQREGHGEIRAKVVVPWRSRCRVT